MTETRQDRLRRDVEVLRALERESVVFELASLSGEPPDHCTVAFRGRGLTRDPGPTGEPQVIERHEIELRFPYSYPDRSPDVRWLTPIHHPNVSFSGFITLRELALEWTPDSSLETLLDRLWDVARFAYLNRDSCSNVAARSWLEARQDIALPIDPRPLRESVAPRNENVVRYVRRGEAPPAPREWAADAAEEVLFIDDETLPPPRPAPPRAPRPTPPRQRPRPAADDDVLYIGDD